MRRVTPRAALEAGWLALALLVPITFQRWSYDAFELPKQYVTLVVTQSALVAALALWVAGEPRAGRALRTAPRAMLGWVGRRPGAIAGLAVGGAWLLATAASTIPEQSWWGLPPRWAGARAQLAYASLFVVASCALRRPVQAARLSVVSAAAGAVAGGYAIAQRLGRDPFEWGGYLGASVAADLSRRPPGTFGNPNFLAGYLALSLFLTAGAVLGLSGRWARGFLGVALALQSAALLLTQTRGAWLGVLAGAAAFATLLAALRGRRWRRWLLAGATAGTLALVALRLAQPLLPPGSLLERAATILSPGEQTAGIRLTLWRLVGPSWLTKPLTGFGPDALAPVFQRAYGPELVEAEGALGGQSQYNRAENAVIDTLLATGLLGALAMAAVGVVVMAALGRLLRGTRDPATAMALGAANLDRGPVIAGLAAALTAHVVAQQFNVEVVGASFLSWLVAGALVGLASLPPGEPASVENDDPHPANLALAVGAAVLCAVGLGWWELRPLRAGVAYEAGLVAERAGKPADGVPQLMRANSLWPHYYLFWAELAYADRAAARAAPAEEKERLYRGALAAVEQVVRVNPAHPLAWSYWGDVAGEVAVASGDVALRNRAKAAHVRATSLAPNWWRYWSSAGETDMLMGDFPAAKERYARAAALNPGNWTLWASLGDASNRQGDKQTARSAYERALGLHPGAQTEATIQRAIASLG